jgi:hypothetical protein
MGEMDQLQVILTPDVITLMAYLAGAFVFGFALLVCLFYLADNINRWI